MIISHCIGKLNVLKKAKEDVGFMLTNSHGSYCCFFGSPASRYCGMFYFDAQNKRMLKSIESIEIVGKTKVTSVENRLCFATREKSKVKESFLMPQNRNSLLYSLSSRAEIDVFFDCKDSYDNRQWGRYYDIFEEGGCIIVKFTKRTDHR